MNKSLEKIRDIKSLINEVYDDRKCQGELTEGARKSWLCFKQYCDDINQDLERLEKINEVWHDNEPMESVDINDEHLQELYDYINKLEKENEQLKEQRDSLAINNGELVVKVTDLQKENQELLVNKNLAQKLAVEYKNKIDKLEKENQKLKEELQLTETARQLIYNELKCCSGMSEYIEKLQNAIEVLKDYLKLEVDIDTKTIITDVGDISIVGATKEDVEDLMLLKEVLE